MLTTFKQKCTEKSYLNQIDSLFNHLAMIKSETKEFIYKVDNQDSLSAYVMFPENNVLKRPCIIILHGGGWYIGHPLSRINIPKDFNELGFVSVSIEHRLKGRQDATPLQGLQDAYSSIGWARNNAGVLGIDPQKITISGLSSGGTLAALTALSNEFDPDSFSETSQTPNAVILWSACVDATINAWFVYCLNNAVPIEKMSPIHLIKPSNIPFLIFQADNDEFNDSQTHIEFCARMHSFKNSCELVLFENTTHTEVYEKDMISEYKDFYRTN